MSFGSNVAPKRRLRVAEAWRCACGMNNPRFAATCLRCNERRPKRPADSTA